MKRVLVTGVAGYIGSVLARELLKKQYSVVGIDLLKFGGESILEIYDHPKFKFINGDIRDRNDLDIALKKIDAVIHLAAIVGDPACKMEPELAEETNWDASKLLFEKCSKIDTISNFVFSSTCSNYGKMNNNQYVDENSPLNPISHYAKLKVKFENYLLSNRPKNGMAATSLRFSTVYGLSPRMRFDLTVNDFMREISMGKELVVFGEQFWRPYCHVVDLARSCILILEKEKNLVDNQVFGVGSTDENYTKQMIVNEILKLIPSAKIKYVQRDEDPRDYRVNFSKINNDLGFEITKTVPDGLRDVHDILQTGIINKPFDSKYSNTGYMQ
tara:strand:- start:944 stop:1930 length:987 start_codon:yes stop_codon:yes gene_type:complete